MTQTPMTESEVKKRKLQKLRSQLTASSTQMRRLVQSSVPEQTSSTRKLPSVFLGGFPKCGSTTLSLILRAIPDLGFPAVKETRYFNRFPEAGLTVLEHFFSSSEGELLCDMTPGAFLRGGQSLQRLLELSRHFDCLYFIYVSRDPVHRAVSQFFSPERLMRRRRNHQKRGITTPEVKVFENAMKDERDRLFRWAETTGLPLEMRPKPVLKFDMIWNSLYDLHRKRLDTFLSDNGIAYKTLDLNFEELLSTSAQTQTVIKVADFLGLGAGQDLSVPEEVHKTKSDGYDKEMYREMARPAVNDVLELISARLS